jgi:hypothetical protein
LLVVVRVRVKVRVREEGTVRTAVASVAALMVGGAA